MEKRHDITPMMETVLTTLGPIRKGDTKIWCETFAMNDTPASIRSTRGILARLVKIGYAQAERVNGRDYWTITEAGEHHWPTAEEMEETSRKLRELVAKVAQ